MSLKRILLAPVASVWLFAASGLVADTVHLKNGRLIEGKVTDNRQTSGEVIVEIGTAGRVTLRGSQVEKVQKGEAGEVLQRERVAVKIPGAEFYSPAGGSLAQAQGAGSNDKEVVLDFGENGKARLDRGSGLAVESAASRTIEGSTSSLSDDKTIVLDLVEGGQVRIERRPGVEVARLTSAAEPKPAAAVVDVGGTRKIRTTHAVYLKNGRKLQGSLVPTPDSEPVKLDIGAMGRLTIARSQIAAEGIQAEAGTIDLPPEAPPAAPAGQEAPAQPGTGEPQTRDQMRRELREELLREMLDQMIQEKIDAAAGDVHAAREAIEDAESQLAPERVQAIEQAVAELGRQRNQNRVRAERQLVALGADVLPYLETAASNPFELTRRAVQRIVRDIGDVQGAPIAIAGLTDGDDFVRSLAHEALRRILPATTIAYSAGAPEAARARAQAEYQLVWDNLVREQARDAIIKRLASQK